MAEARARLAKLRRRSESLLDALLVNPSNNPDALVKVERLAAAAERSYRNAHKDLVAAQKFRAAAPKPAEIHPEPPTGPSNLDDAELDRLTPPLAFASVRFP